MRLSAGPTCAEGEGVDQFFHRVRNRSPIDIKIGRIYNKRRIKEEKDMRMEKLIAMLLVIILVVSGASCTLADDKDTLDDLWQEIVKLNTDAIVDLRIRIEAELVTRFGQEIETLGTGLYTVGAGIKSGSYKLMAVSDSLIGVCRSLGAVNSEGILLEKLLYTGDSIHIDLTDGMILMVAYGCLQVIDDSEDSSLTP